MLFPPTNICNISRKIFSVNWAIEDSSKNSSNDANILKNSGKLHISHVALGFSSLLCFKSPCKFLLFLSNLWIFSFRFGFYKVTAAIALVIFIPSSWVARYSTLPQPGLCSFQGPSSHFFFLLFNGAFKPVIDFRILKKFLSLGFTWGLTVHYEIILHSSVYLFWSIFFFFFFFLCKSWHSECF